MKTTRPGKMTLLTGLLTLLTAGASFAQQMNYQGRLTDGAGAPVADTQYSITFDIYDSAAGTNGTNKKWGPQVVPADTVQGRFNVILGPTDTSGSNIVSAFDGGTRYLQITFQGNAILPRQQILNAPTAFYAETAGQLANVFVKNGNLGVGTTNPIARLEVVGGASGANGLRIKKAIGNDIAGALHGLQLEVSSGSARSMGIGVADSGLGIIQVKEVNVGYHDLLLQPIAGNVGIGSATATTTIAGNATIDGTVGIGTNSPHAFEKLHVHGGRLRISDSGAGVLELAKGSNHPDDVNYIFTAADGNLHLSTDNSNPILLQPNNTGNVGVGTGTPTQAKLVINGTAGTFTGQVGYVEVHGAVTGAAHVPNTLLDTVRYPRALSLYANGGIAGFIIYAHSDERIKRVEGPSDGAGDLATLLKLEITDYGLVDVVAHGNRQQKKVIAQQVEQVYPSAVSQTTGVVPDIYQSAVIENGWVKLTTDLKPGESVRLIGKKKEGVHKVLEVKAGQFRTDFEADTGKVFVYGREVNDFRTVDYDAIAMLNVSATQELARQVEALSKSEARVAQLEREMSELRKLVTHLVATGKTPQQTAQTSTEETPLVTASLRR